MAVDGLTGQAEAGRDPPAHVYVVHISVVVRHGRIFLSDDYRDRRREERVGVQVLERR